MENKIPKRKSVFLKVGFIFLAAAIPLSIAAAFLFSWQIKSMDEAMVSNFQRTITQNYNNMIKELEKVDVLCLDGVYDESAVMLASSLPIMSDYEKTVTVNRLFSRLKILKNSSEYIKTLRMYFPVYGKVLTSDSELIPFAGSISEVEGYYPEELRSRYQMKDGNMYSVYLPAGSVPEDQKFNCILVIEFDIRAIELDLGGEIPDDGKFMLMNKDGQRVAGEELEEKSWVVKLTSPINDMTLTGMLPASGMNSQVKLLRTLLVLYSIALILFVLVIVGVLAKFIRSPVRKLMKALESVEQGNYGVRLAEIRRDEFGYLNHSFNQMAGKIEYLVDQVYREKILNQEAELKQLQSWINPHFLYNSFFSISNMARLEDHENIKRFSEYLGKYYQFVTKVGLQESVALADEVECCKVFVNIQEMRFGAYLRVMFQELPEICSNWRIPRLIMQPFIENAFQHGLSSVEEQILKVSFVMGEQEDESIIIIEDNGIITDDQIRALNESLNQEKTTGITNVHRRLKLYYGEKAGVKIERSTLGGLLAKIIIMDGGKGYEDSGS